MVPCRAAINEFHGPRTLPERTDLFLTEPGPARIIGVNVYPIHGAMNANDSSSVVQGEFESRRVNGNHCN